MFYELRIETTLVVGSKIISSYSLPEVNISQLAKLGIINPGLLRKYVSGSKKASEKQAQRFMEAIEKLAAKLNSITLTT